MSAMAKGCLGAGLGKANAGLREASAPCGVWGEWERCEMRRTTDDMKDHDTWPAAGKYMHRSS